jgi:hypothetical protein
MNKFISRTCKVLALVGALNANDAYAERKYKVDELGNLRQQVLSNVGNIYSYISEKCQINYKDTSIDEIFINEGKEKNNKGHTFINIILKSVSLPNSIITITYDKIDKDTYFGPNKQFGVCDNKWQQYPMDRDVSALSNALTYLQNQELQLLASRKAREEQVTKWAEAKIKRGEAFILHYKTGVVINKPEEIRSSQEKYLNSKEEWLKELKFWVQNWHESKYNMSGALGIVAGLFPGVSQQKANEMAQQANKEYQDLNPLRMKMILENICTLTNCEKMTGADADAMSEENPFYPPEEKSIILWQRHIDGL